jgi:hypothetical protein
MRYIATFALRACLKIEKELDFAGDVVGFDSRQRQSGDENRQI